MRKIVKFAPVAAVAIGLLTAGAALAQYNEAGIGKTFKVTLVTAYQPCTTPNTTTSDNTPACTAVRSDPTCGFVGGAHGLMYIRSAGSKGWVVKTSMLGLENACKGKTIHFYATLRTSMSSECTGSACTVDTANVDLGSCVINDNGKCLVNVPLFTTPGLIKKYGGSELTDVKVIRTTGPGAPATSFRYGIVTSSDS